MVRSAGAQPDPASVDLGTIPVCTQCPLRVTRVALLGDSLGRGSILSEEVQVIYSDSLRLFGVFQIGGSYIQLFEASGRFLRSIGQPGKGPGEIAGIVDVQFNGSKIAVLDYGASRFLQLDLAGHAASEARIELRAGRFRMLSDSSVVLGAMERTTSLVGWPLHEVMLATGRATRHFGSVDGRYNASDPSADDVVLGWSPLRERIWLGRRAQLHLEEWHSTGTLMRTVSGKVPWFPAPGNRLDPSEPPRPQLRHFGIDGDERLVIASFVPDVDWARARTIGGSERAVLMRDLAQLVDTRIDVFDLRRRRHMGTITWDGAFAGLTAMGSGLVAYRVEYDKESVGRIAVYRIGL